MVVFLRCETQHHVSDFLVCSAIWKSHIILAQQTLDLPGYFLACKNFIP